MSASGGVGATAHLKTETNIAGANVPSSSSAIFFGAFTNLQQLDLPVCSVPVPDGVAVSESWRSGPNQLAVKLANYTGGIIAQPQEDYFMAAVRPTSGRSNGVGPLMGLVYNRLIPGILNVNPNTTETINVGLPGARPGDCVAVSARFSWGTEMVLAQALISANDNLQLKIGNAGTLQNDIDPNNLDIGIIRAGATGGTGALCEITQPGIALPAVNVPMSSSAVQAVVVAGARPGDVAIGQPDGTLGPDICVSNIRVTGNDTVELRYNNFDNAADMMTVPRTWNFGLMRQVTVR